jgi:hypothetical protein
MKAISTQLKDLVGRKVQSKEAPGDHTIHDFVIDPPLVLKVRLDGPEGAVVSAASCVVLPEAPAPAPDDGAAPPGDEGADPDEGDEPKGRRGKRK